MLLAVIALYYKLDNYKKAESYLKKLCAINKEVAEVFGDVEGMDFYIPLLRGFSFGLQRELPRKHNN